MRLKIEVCAQITPNPSTARRIQCREHISRAASHIENFRISSPHPSQLERVLQLLSLCPPLGLIQNASIVFRAQMLGENLLRFRNQLCLDPLPMIAIESSSAEAHHIICSF